MKDERRGSLVLLMTALLVFAATASACGDDDPPGSAARQEANNDPNNDEPDAGEEPDTDRVEDEDPEDPPEVDFPVVPAGVETTLSVDQLQAGDTVDVGCRIFDEAGVTMEFEEAPRLQLTVVPGQLVERDGEVDGRYRGLKPGTAVFTCAVPTLGLIDVEPAELTITAGPVEKVLTDLDRNVIRAGESAQVACEAYDALGNPVEGAQFTVVSEPVVEGVVVDGFEIAATTAGLYTVSCQVDGADEVVADTLEVIPNRAAAMMIAKVPEQDVYGLGQVVGIDAIVTDRFGNRVEDAVVEVESRPAAVRFGDTRFRFDAEGIYTLSAEVTSDTENGLPITAETSLVVNGAGPSIACEAPLDGAMIDAAPGGQVTVRARVTDANGVTSVRINDQDATVQVNGLVEHAVTTRYGINFIDIVATDAFGERNSRTCAFLVSDDWIGEGQFLDDAVTLRLAQAAIDDGNRGGAVNSLGDLLHTVLNSQQLVNSVDGALRAQSPFINRCVQDVCLPFVGCNCVFRLRVDYQSMQIRGPNEVSLQLVDGGLRAVATMRNIQLNIGIGGTVSTSGSATLSSLTVDMTFNMNLQNNRPDISLRQINAVNVGGVSTNFSGLAGFVIDILVDLFEGTVRNLIRDQLRNFIRDSFDSLLDGVVSGLDISTLGTNFDVPRLGGGSVRLGFGLRFSSLLTNNARALFGLGLRFTGPVNHGGPTLGAPRPPGTVRLDPTTNRAVAAGLHIGLMSQVMHTLWRGGMFDIDISGGLLGADNGIQADLRTNLPPVIELQDGGRVKLTIGAAQLSLVYPGLFDEPLDVSLGAVVTSRVQLRNGDELAFDQLQIQELIFSTEDIDLDPTTRDILESFLTRLVQRLVNDALNNALPALPIPSFELPRAVTDFGLPAGSSLGLRDTGLRNSTTHFILEGNFGLQ